MAEARAEADEAKAEAVALKAPVLKAHAAGAEADAPTLTGEERADAAAVAAAAVDPAVELGEAKARLAQLSSEAAARDGARDEGAR